MQGKSSIKQIILVTGAAGQLGMELTAQLRKYYGANRVIASDIRKSGMNPDNDRFEYLDVLDKKSLDNIIAEFQITTIYHLAAMLSAVGEQKIQQAWTLNMDGLLNILEAARWKNLRVFWPSSIAVFGPDARKVNTPQNSPLNPETVYGISKVAGEQWCKYYHKRFGVDTRSLRYPGLIGKQALPGGGTTDYAVEIFHSALNGELFTCPLNPHTRLPMMHMDDAVRAAVELMEVDGRNIRIRTSYNLAGMSFSPEELTEKILPRFPGLKVVYEPDHREEIASGWPDSIDDAEARKDWQWAPQHNMDTMIQDMISS